MIKVINESSENMEVEFAYFHPHVGMRKCSKEKAIQMVENFLNDMKNGSGYDIAGRGFAIYCTQSPDADGQMIYGRNDPDEFLSSLKESTIVESISDTISDFSSSKTTDGYEIPLSREKSFINKLSKLGYHKDDEEDDPQTHAHYVWYSNGEEKIELQYDNGEKTIIVRVNSDESKIDEDINLKAIRERRIQDHLTGAKVYVGMKEYDSAISSCKVAIEMIEYEKEESMNESTDKYQFTLPFSDEEDLEYQRKVAKQLGLDFEFVDETPEYMVFRGSKELLTKYCDTYGQNSKDIEKLSEAVIYDKVYETPSDILEDKAKSVKSILEDSDVFSNIDVVEGGGGITLTCMSTLDRNKLLEFIRNKFNFMNVEISNNKKDSISAEGSVSEECISKGTREVKSHISATRGNWFLSIKID